MSRPDRLKTLEYGDDNSVARVYGHIYEVVLMRPRVQDRRLVHGVVGLVTK